MKVLFQQLIVVVGLGVGALFGAGPSRMPLHVWQFSMDEELSQKIIQDYEHQNPNIDIILQQLSWDHGYDKLVTSFIAKNAPDVFEIGSTWGTQFAQSGVLKELTSDVHAFQQDYLMWEPVTYEEKIFGVPWLLGTRFVLYNRTLFAQAGLDPSKPPKTWEELKRAASRIRALGRDVYGFGIAVAEELAPWQTFMPFVWQQGGNVISPDGKLAQIDVPAIHRALSLYQSLSNTALLDRQGQLDQLFASGKLGMMISGAWNFKSIEKTNPTLSYGVALVPTPSKLEKPLSFGGGEMLVILKESKHPKEALQFIRYLASYDVELLISKFQKNVLPSLKTALADPYFEKDERWRVVAEQMKYVQAPPAHMAWTSIGKKISHLIDETLLEKKDPRVLLPKLQREVEALLSKTEKAKPIRSQWFVFGVVIVALGIFLWMAWKRSSTTTWGTRATWILVSPWLVTFLVFYFYPLLYALVVSFADYHILSSQFSFKGIQNYVGTISDPLFLEATWHTLLFAVGTIPFTVLGSLILAALIHQKIPLKGLFQAGFFLPVVTSVIVIATLFTYFYAENGFLNFILEALHIPRPTPAWLVNQRWALVGIMAMAVWSSIGFYMILFLAALQSIPVELYEASRLDGAGGLQQFFKITLPQLKPMIAFVVVIQTINSLQVFPEIFTMTKGGPAGATTTIVYYLYEKGFRDFQLGEASAVAYVLCILIGIFSLIHMKLLKETS